MAVGMSVVRATITKDQEAAFNQWYNNEHLPQVLRYNGAISGRRYRKLVGEDKYDYMAVYELASEDLAGEPQAQRRDRGAQQESNHRTSFLTMRTRKDFVVAGIV